MKITLTLEQIGAVMAMLRDDADDEQLLLDTLEGETDLFELVGALLHFNEEDEGVIAALAEQIDSRRLRKDRAAKRIESRRNAIGALLDCARLDKLTLPEATISRMHQAPKIVVTDADALPDAYCTFTRKPDMAAIKAANENIPGTSMDNGGVGLTIRRK